MQDDNDERAERRSEREQSRHERDDFSARKSALNAAASSLPNASEEKIIDRAEHFLVWLKKE